MSIRHLFAWAAAPTAALLLTAGPARADTAPTTAYPLPRPPDVEEEIHHFHGRISRVGADVKWIEARPWLGLGGLRRFHTTIESKFFVHGVPHPLSEIRRGLFVGIWYRIDPEDGVRWVERIQIGGKPPREGP